MKPVKSTLAVLATLSLTACSGGGSDDGPQPTQLDQAELAVAESSSAQFTARYDVQSVEKVNPDSNITISYSGKTISVESKKLGYPIMGVYRIVMKNGDQRVIQRFEVMGVNTSAEKEEAVASQIEGNVGPIVNLQSDRRLYEFIVDTAYLKGDITPEGRKNRMESFSPESSAAYSNALQALESAERTYGSYLSGKADEEDLKAAVSHAESELGVHGSYGLTKIRNVESLASTYLGSLPEEDIVFVPEQDRFSRFFSESLMTSDSEPEDPNYKTQFSVLSAITK